MKHEHFEYLLPNHITCDVCGAWDDLMCDNLQQSHYCCVDVSAFPVVGRVCGLPVREVPRDAFDSLLMSPIPLQHEVERDAWMRFYDETVEWVGADWGVGELEVTPHLSKIAAGYLTRYESMGYEDIPEYYRNLWEVWHITDESVKED